MRILRRLHSTSHSTMAFLGDRSWEAQFGPSESLWVVFQCRKGNRYLLSESSISNEGSVGRQKRGGLRSERVRGMLGVSEEESGELKKKG